MKERATIGILYFQNSMYIWHKGSCDKWGWMDVELDQNCFFSQKWLQYPTEMRKIILCYFPPCILYLLKRLQHFLHIGLVKNKISFSHTLKQSNYKLTDQKNKNILEWLFNTKQMKKPFPINQHEWEFSHSISVEELRSIAIYKQINCCTLRVWIISIFQFCFKYFDFAKIV